MTTDHEDALAEHPLTGVDGPLPQASSWPLGRGHSTGESFEAARRAAGRAERGVMSEPEDDQTQESSPATEATGEREEWIKRKVDQAPPLSEEQRERLAHLWSLP